MTVMWVFAELQQQRPCSAEEDAGSFSWQGMAHCRVHEHNWPFRITTLQRCFSFKFQSKVGL
jgi:hypothetical protein